MPNATSVTAVLEREFLPIRGKLLEIAAALDRIARAGKSVDPRMEQIREALGAIARSEGTDRAEQVQMLFSLPYDPNWRA